MTRTILAVAVVASLLTSTEARAQGAGAADLQAHLAALKQTMEQSRQALRSYRWVETMTVYLKGEQKSFAEDACVFGPDGKVVKTPIVAPPPPKDPGGFRGRMMEKKREELTNTMKQALALIRTYAPPDHARIQAASAAGKVAVEPVQPGKVVRIVVRDYELAGDSLSITMDLSTNRLLGMSVNTWLGSPGTPVSLTTTTGTLPAGATYTAQSHLSLPTEQLTVDIVNGEYQKI